MEPMRWIRGVVPIAALALMGAGVMPRPLAILAADPPGPLPPCPASGPPGKGIGDGIGWYRLEAILDGTGSLTGQRLAFGVIGGVGWATDLPAESFATGPVGTTVLVGADDGVRSRLSLVDATRGCATAIGNEASVVRSALLAPDASAIVEHRVDRVTRSDLGVWRRPVGGGRAVRLLAGISFDRAYGRTFSTELRWALDGRLAATSCGELACRTRIMEAGSGRSVEIGRTGPVIGVAEDAVIAYAVCPGLPCALLRFDARGGQRMLAQAAGRAAMAGGRIVFEDATGRLGSMDASTGDRRRIDAAAGLVPMPDGSGARAGVAHADDAVLLAPDARVDGIGTTAIGRQADAARAIVGVTR
ncbi:MAG: hypothetical protein ABIR11_11655 [Candidatus Limnocylindrales bacterium]